LRMGWTRGVRPTSGSRRYVSSRSDSRTPSGTSHWRASESSVASAGSDTPWWDSHHDRSPVSQSPSSARSASARRIRSIRLTAVRGCASNRGDEPSVVDTVTSP
jgi:hypothetical protein